MNKRTHPYYKFDKLLSYNAFINICAGGRGIGKTYGAEVTAIRAFIKRGEQWIYCRRTDEEKKASKNGFFTAVGNEFPDWDIRVQGNDMEIAHVSTREDKKRQWQTMGYFISISTAQAQKGRAFPNVKKIIYDEFIPEDGSHYLRSEVKSFLNFVSTVDRYQDRVTVIMLANAVSIMCPYFAEWDIDPSEARNGLVISKNGLIVAHFPDSEDFKQSVYQSRLGQLIVDTDYAKFAVENQFSDNHKTLVEQKDPDAYPMFTMETVKGTFSIWHNMDTGAFYAQEDLKKINRHFTLIPENVSPQKLMITPSDPKLRVLRRAYHEGRFTFDHSRTRNVFAEISQR